VEEWVELRERNKWWLLGNMPFLFRFGWPDDARLTPVFTFYFLARLRLRVRSSNPPLDRANDGQTEENDGQIRVQEK